MKDTSHVALVDSLKRQGGNQGGTNTAAVFGSENLDRILFLLALLLRPVKDLSQGLCTSLLEVGVLVEHRAISTDVARFVALLLADSSNTASRESSSSCTNELSGSADELELGACAGQVQLLAEEVVCLLQVLPRVPKDKTLVMRVVPGFYILTPQ